MKILVTLDTKEYSQKIIKDVARLANNTLADIVLLAVQEQSREVSRELTAALLKYRQDLYSYFAPEELPYGDNGEDRWEQQGKGDWTLTARGMKQCVLRIRAGSSVSRLAVTTAREMECDLVVLGCSGEAGCEWDGEMNVPLRIAEDSSCPVLIIKNRTRVNQIVSILDQSVVSQEALEMVNQLVTVHGAGLKIIGVCKSKESDRDRLEQRMVELLRYYNDRSIDAWVKLIDTDDVREYVTRWSQEGIVALWMGGKQSLIRKLFGRSMIDRLLESTRSSLLILR